MDWPRESGGYPEGTEHLYEAPWNETEREPDTRCAECDAWCFEDDMHWLREGRGRWVCEECCLCLQEEQ